MIYETEKLQKEIENSNHYSKCLTDYYLNEFNRNKNNFDTYKSQYYRVNSEKNNIIGKIKKKQIKEKEYEAQDKIKSENYEKEKKRLNDIKEIKQKELDNTLEELKKERDSEALQDELEILKN